jgi:hypothetical protein
LGNWIVWREQWILGFLLGLVKVMAVEEEANLGFTHVLEVAAAAAAAMAFGQIL